MLINGIDDLKKIPDGAPGWIVWTTKRGADNPDTSNFHAIYVLPIKTNDPKVRKVNRNFTWYLGISQLERAKQSLKRGTHLDALAAGYSNMLVHLDGWSFGPSKGYHKTEWIPDFCPEQERRPR